MSPPPKRPIAYDNLMLLDSAGVRVVGATDAGNIGTLHGPSLHREFELMAEAGMRPMDILTSATKNAAAVMGRQAEVGTLEKGKYADLVILDGDPLADIKNTRKIFKVMKGGEFFN
jgi:imidazolonepropionase-like amidohydrolase